MLFLNFFADMLVYFIVITIFYFSIDKLMQSKTYVNWSIPKGWNDFLFGALLGLINCLASYSLGELTPFGKAPIYFFLSLILVFYKGYQPAWYALFPIMIYQAFIYPIDPLFYFNIACTFVAIFLVQILSHFYSKKIISFNLVVCFTLLIIVSIILNLTLFETENLDEGFLIGAFSLFTNLVLFAIFSGLINFSHASNLLYTSSNFTFLRYYRSAIARPTINNYIRKQKIKYGILSIFTLEYSAKNSKEKNREIQHSILESIANYLPSEAILFNLIQNTYGFFLPLVSDNIDFEQKFANIIKKIPTQHLLSNKEVIETKIKYGNALYGIHNSSINTLFNYAIFALNKINNQNTFNFFDPKLWLKDQKENFVLNQLDKALSLDGFTNNYTNLWDIHNLEPFGYWVEQENIAEYSMRESITEQIYYQNWQVIFNRYFANEAIKKIKNSPIFFDYDLSIFDNTFNPKNFLRDLENENINPSFVFLIIKKESFANLKDLKIIKQNIDFLEKMKINFVVDNESSSKAKKIFKTVKYSFVKDLNFKKNFPDSKIISFNVKNLEMLKKHLKIGVDYIGGPFFIKKNIVTNFDKQSKIYLEKVLNRLNNE